jgi:hypothetical protein
MTQRMSPQIEDQIIAATSFEDIALPSGEKVRTPVRSMTFKKWGGLPKKETFGNKALVDVYGQPMFAELAIMHFLIQSGWQARWIETYATGGKEPKVLSEWKDDKYKNQILDPIVDDVAKDCLKNIAILNGSSYSGCWDVFGWRDDKVIFVESKRFKKDSIQGTQIRWLDAGLRSGLLPNNFIIIQWDFK